VTGPLPPPLEVVARAKVNLCLAVHGVRADGGHEIESLAVSVTEPHDVVALARLAPGAGVHLALGGDTDGVPGDATNLAVRAAASLLAAAGRPPDTGVEIALHKRIPPGAGLGGGSADAAAVLDGVRALLDLAVTDTYLDALARTLGADVAFCLHGGAAWMRGRGDELEPTVVSPLRMLVAVPPVACPTAEVYAAWDALGGPRGRTVDPPAGVPGLPELRNDLEPAACHLRPELAAFRAAVERETGRPAVLSGSGSAYVVLYADDETPGRAVAAVRDATGARVFSAALAPAGLDARP
jgi:4-diphosphocytidyl-2-C-methyl-D-erythritol kinase